MSGKRERALSKLSEVESELARSPLGKALLDGGLSFIPGLGPAITSALATRAANLAQRNTTALIAEVRAEVARLGEEKFDGGFLESDEFVAVLMRTLELNARTSRGDKVKLFARAFLGFLSGTGPALAFKEGFLRIVDELEPEHVAVLAIIYRESSPAGQSQGRPGRAWVESIGKELALPQGRALAYGVHLMRFGLVQDDSIGRAGYTPGRFKITEYGVQFCEHLGQTGAESSGDG